MTALIVLIVIAVLGVVGLILVLRFNKTEQFV